MITFLSAWTLVAIAALIFRHEPIWREENGPRRRGMLLLASPGMIFGLFLALAYALAFAAWTTVSGLIGTFTKTWNGEDVGAFLVAKEVPTPQEQTP